MHRELENAPVQKPVGSFSIRALMIGAPDGREGGFGQSQRATVISRLTVPSSPAHSRTIGARDVGAIEYDPAHSSGLPPWATKSEISSSVLSVDGIIRGGRNRQLRRAG